jgi:glutathione synthase/RimK-type ligase-like ATP-grasp enzyme
MSGILSMVINSHLKLLPDVPMVGWDVAMTNKGVVLLEVNLSCNFFRGSFNVPNYIRMVDEYFLVLEAHRNSSDSKHSKQNNNTKAIKTN